MNVPPILLLVLGSIFGVAYGLFITIGWAITRKNRRKYQRETGLTYLKLYDLETGKITEGENEVKCFSLQNNKLLTPDGGEIDLNSYNAYIAKGKSSAYPSVENGDLILIDSLGKIRYAFDIPDLNNYR